MSKDCRQKSRNKEVGKGDVRVIRSKGERLSARVSGTMSTWHLRGWRASILRRSTRDKGTSGNHSDNGEGKKVPTGSFILQDAKKEYVAVKQQRERVIHRIGGGGSGAGMP